MPAGYSGFILASLMIGHHLSASALWNTGSGVRWSGGASSRPILAYFCCTTGSLLSCGSEQAVTGAPPALPRDD